MRDLDPRTKLLLILAISFLAVTLDQWFTLLGLCVFSFLLLLWAKPRPSHLKMALLMAVLTTWGVMFSQALFYQNFPRTVVFYLVPPFEFHGVAFGGLPVYLQGLYYGAVQSLRFNAGMFAGLALCLSTSVDKLYYALTRLPVPRGLSFLAVSAIRFLPVITEEFKTVRTALRLKGYRPLRCGLRTTVQTELSVPLPVLAGAVRRARDLSDSLLTRGFDPLAPPPPRRLIWPRWEKWVAGAFLLVSALVLVAKVLFWLYLQEILYLEGLRGLYALARNWL
ncbi:MAG: energy-coupling factor transporter transmembrane protein EcfT [Thermodesulfobacteria bacterium]|nr:energy-coupling factor transporter transmembrane protein EcfT [Thermodesulfobacteriota bacterium]